MSCLVSRSCLLLHAFFGLFASRKEASFGCKAAGRAGGQSAFGVGAWLAPSAPKPWLHHPLSPSHLSLLPGSG